MSRVASPCGAERTDEETAPAGEDPARQRKALYCWGSGEATSCGWADVYEELMGTSVGAIFVKVCPAVQELFGPTLTTLLIAAASKQTSAGHGHE